MRLGVLSDLHANRVALDAVVEDLPPVDGLVCAGDVIGYNPWPADCVEFLRDREVPTVMGNHDRAVATGTSFRFNGMARAGVEHAADHLRDEQVRWLADLPDERRVANDRVKLVHGHPDDPNRYTYPDLFSSDLLGDEDVLVLGHTHIQHHEMYDEGVVLNPGSVGQPRDGDPRAAYAVLDLDTMTVEEHRVEYDVATVETAIGEAGLPEETAARLANGR
jgi:putative phosphoesterase